jgi:hypothetical protein
VQDDDAGSRSARVRMRANLLLRGWRLLTTGRYSTVYIGKKVGDRRRHRADQDVNGSLKFHASDLPRFSIARRSLSLL